VAPIAIVSDIHANLPALEAVLARIDELGIDDVLCGGDLVGYGPRPNEVCELIQARGIPTIYGNYDYAIARESEDCGCFYPTEADRVKGESSVAWTLQHTSEDAKAFMRDLPFDLRLDVGGRRVRLVHGSPRKVNEYLLEDRAAKTFERIAGIADCEVLVFGHTHKPWIHECAGVLFVNVGSVGKPKDGDPRACFAVLAADAEPAIERVAYDADAVADEIRACGLPAELADDLVAAR
jgi:putative phosphoesterase